MEINHFSHEEHPLVFIESREEGSNFRCDGCGEHISPGSPSYRCDECDYDLHESCTKLPETMTHKMHTSHELTLLAKPPYSGGCYCNICHKNFNGFTYNCSVCQFDIDVSCALNEGTKYRHQGHEHPLVLRQRPASFDCDACGKEKKDESFQCTSCEFWAHKSCLSLPRKLVTKDHPDHPLALAYNLPLDYRYYKLDCDVCHKKLDYVFWVYFCYLCRYFVHLSCAKPITDNGSNSDGEDAKGLDKEGLVQFPLTDSFEKLITDLVNHNNAGFETLPDELNNDWSHEHPLILFDGKNRDQDNELKNVKKPICDGCIEYVPPDAPYYSCGKCQFFLHVHCAALPAKLENHPLHPEHSVSLYQKDYFYDDIKCTYCLKLTNGFYYKCETCEDVVMDVKCASLPSSIAHEAHKHGLLRKEYTEPIVCSACTLTFTGVGFSCEVCKYQLNQSCAQLPHSAAHRWDKHTLKLDYPPYSDHPDMFMCEVCETEIHPKFWQYRCKGCDQSFHTGCVPPLDRFPNIKFGRTLLLEKSHPHLLTFVRLGTFKWKCHGCGDPANIDVAFECEQVECKFSLCVPCIRKMRDA